MKNTALLLALAIISISVYAQQKPSYTQLKQYEGLYQYRFGDKIKFAASPKDTVLFAVINQSRYLLKPLAADVFTDQSGDHIVFLRNASNLIDRYTVDKDTFRLISNKIIFGKEMWYPKLVADVNKYQYHYRQPQKTGDGLPTSTAVNAGLDTALLDNMVNKIVRGDYPNVHSVLVIKGGKLVFEEYFYEFTRDSVQELRSASKSFVSALIGIAIDKGIIKSKHEPVVSFFPEYKLANYTDAKGRITIENLLSNQTGIDYDISNGKAAGNEVAMGNTDDWVKYTLDLPMIDTPGGKGMYASGNPVTAGKIIEKASGMPLHDFAKKYLFDPMGIKNFKWNFGPNKSNAEDFCQVYLTPREMAKFGLTYLNGGQWNGRQVVPRQWVDESLTKHSIVQGVDYGYLWWLKYLDADGTRYYGKAAQGNGGQKIYLFAAQDLVVVVTGGNYNAKTPSDELIRKYILPSFNKKQ
ncbi:MAG: serine hydrolase [Mucilaginibacter sp.]